MASHRSSTVLFIGRCQKPRQQIARRIHRCMVLSSCLTAHSHPYLSIACTLHPSFAVPSLDRLWSRGPGIADAMLQFVQRPPTLHLLPTFTAAPLTGQSTAASVSRSRSAITAARQIEATSRFVACANSPTPTTGTLTPT